MSRNFLSWEVEKRKIGLNRANWGHFIKYTIKGAMSAGEHAL